MSEPESQPPLGVYAVPETLASRADRIARTYQIERARCLAILERVDLEASRSQILDAPDLEEALATGVDPERILRLFERDPRLTARVATWDRAHDFDSPLMSAEELAREFVRAADLHTAYREPLASEGAPPTTAVGLRWWTARRILVTYPKADAEWLRPLVDDGTVPLSDIARGHAVLDLLALPRIRDVLIRVRESIVRLLADAARRRTAGALWNDALAEMRELACPAVLHAVLRLDALFSRFAGGESSGGMTSLLDAVQHVEAEVLTGTWSDFALSLDAVSARDLPSAYYALAAREHQRIRAAIDEFASSLRGYDAIRAARNHDQMLDLRGLSRAWRRVAFESRVRQPGARAELPIVAYMPGTPLVASAASPRAERPVLSLDVVSQELLLDGKPVNYNTGEEPTPRLGLGNRPGRLFLHLVLWPGDPLPSEVRPKDWTYVHQAVELATSKRVRGSARGVRPWSLCPNPQPSQTLADDLRRAHYSRPPSTKSTPRTRR